jgi:tetratricopeptide (TPR) repeat protein
MEVSHQRKERFYIKLLFGALIAIFLLIGLVWGGHDLYVRWQEKRLVRRAVSAMQHGDDATASLAARTVLELKPESAPAARIVAELAEKSGNRMALDWRHKVVELDPHSVDDALAWAKCALQFGDITIARRALGTVDEQGRQRASYHAVSGLVAQAQKDDDKAEGEWAKAVEIDPNEGGYQLHLGMLRLRAKEKDRHENGKAMLVKLRDDPKQRIPATRALISDGIARRENTQTLMDLARELQAYPEATTNDRIIYLDLLHQAQAPQFAVYLTDLESNVISRPLDLASLLGWMSQNNLNLFALDFVKSLPPEKLESWPIPAVVADLYVRLRDWPKLEALTRDANWRQGEFLRHAYLARALRGQDKTAAAEHEWAAATKAASNQNEYIMWLVRATTEWKWDKEMVDLLWSLTSDPEKQNEAVRGLYQYYARSSDTQGLYRILVRWAELAPDDLNVENNLAQVSLLLNVNLVEARRVAADLYQKMPANAAYATTYAYSVLTKGNAKEAAQIMNTLTEEQLRDPAVSAYYGICLAALRDEKARGFLETGQQAMLLPEEKKLVDKALASLSPRQTTN